MGRKVTDQERVDPAVAALTRVRRSVARASRGRTRPAGAQFSGAKPDSRDPALLGSALDSWVSDGGHRDRLAVSGLLRRWSDIVGPALAEHVVVAGFQPGSDGGTVRLCADSAAWALEMRYLRDRVLERIAEEVGPGLVAEISVEGPAAARQRGRYRVRTGRRSPRL